MSLDRIFTQEELERMKWEFKGKYAGLYIYDSKESSYLLEKIDDKFKVYLKYPLEKDKKKK